MNTNRLTSPAKTRAGMNARQLAGGALLLLLSLAACAVKGKTVPSMSPEDRQFISEVRYIITKKESKLFKSTPPSERAQFIEEFWRVRDPDPSSVENEFREEYYRRIDEANRLFREGSPGWLSDRGRIFILLGEPERRDVYPSGYSFYEPPVEIWMYGMFPIIFVDSLREGIYKLDSTSVRRLSMINVAQMQLKPKGIERNARLFDFTLTVRTTGPGSAVLVMEIPYRVTNLLLDDQSGAYKTQLKLAVSISDSAGKKIVHKEEMRPVSVSPDMLNDLGKNLVLEFTIELAAGNYAALVVLENSADNSQARKEIQFTL